MNANIYVGTPSVVCPPISGFPLINLFLGNPQHQQSLGEWDKTQSRIFHVFTTLDRISSTPESLHSFRSDWIKVSIKKFPIPNSYTGMQLDQIFALASAASNGLLWIYWRAKVILDGEAALHFGGTDLLSV